MKVSPLVFRGRNSKVNAFGVNFQCYILLPSLVYCSSETSAGEKYVNNLAIMKQIGANIMSLE